MTLATTATRTARMAAPYPCRSAYSMPSEPARMAVAIVSEFQGDGVFGTDKAVGNGRLDAVAAADGVEKRILIGVGDAVGWVGDEKRIALLAEEALVGRRISGVGAEQPMLAQRPHLAYLGAPLLLQLGGTVELWLVIGLPTPDVGQQGVRERFRQNLRSRPRSFRNGTIRRLRLVTGRGRDRNRAENPRPPVHRALISCPPLTVITLQGPAL